MRDLYHVTLTTGHVRQSPRTEVRDDVVATLRPLLAQALTGVHAPVPGWPGYTMTGGAEGRCCAVTLWHAAGLADPAPATVPVLTTAVGGHSRCGTSLWLWLHEQAGLPYATDPARVPPEPWCADRLDVGAALDPAALEWTGDWARCVAWTWLEMRGAPKGAHIPP